MDRHVCPRFHRAVELIGKRWTGAVIRVLMDGPMRFSDILKAIPGIHDPLLSRRLKELRRQGVVERRVYMGRPVRIEYALTEKGLELQRVVAELERWAERWVEVPAPPSQPGRRKRLPASRSPALRGASIDSPGSA